MKIQIGVNQKMKLYNVYRICKQNIELIKNIDVTQRDDTDLSKDIKVKIYTIKNWYNLKNILYKLEIIPVLSQYVNECFKIIPESFRDEDSVPMNSVRYAEFMKHQNKLYDKMKDIIELYESMNLENDGNGLDIKLPNCEDLGEYISYLKDINFIFTQCPFLQCDDEILKFGSVDVGSNWLKLIIATTSTCMILNNTASLIDKSLILRSHYINLQQQEEMLKNQQIKNDIAIDYHKTFELLRSAYMDTAINELAKESNKTLDPEEQDKAKRTLEKLIILIDKGCEIYATLDSPDEVQVLFPEIQSHLELPDNIMKYLEDNEQ